MLSIQGFVIVCGAMFVLFAPIHLWRHCQIIPDHFPQAQRLASVGSVATA